MDDIIFGEVLLFVFGILGGSNDDIIIWLRALELLSYNITSFCVVPSS